MESWKVSSVTVPADSGIRDEPGIYSYVPSRETKKCPSGLLVNLQPEP